MTRGFEENVLYERDLCGFYMPTSDEPVTVQRYAMKMAKAIFIGSRYISLTKRRTVQP